MGVIVGQWGVTFITIKRVLAISPILERMCETERAKKTASTVLSGGELGVFEYILGYLYFQKFNPHSPSPPRLYSEWN